MRNLDQARLDYEAALAKRLERIHTRHSFNQAKTAADSLYMRLLQSAVVRIASVGIGLKPDRSDVTIEVAVQDHASVQYVPPSIEGIDVRVNVAGPVSSF